MYTPSYRVRGRGVPILSKPEIDTIGENFVRDFQPSVLTNPAPVDIESFVENYLGMTPDYQLLSHNGIYLGMTVFNDTNRVIVFSQETGRAEYISAKAHTVIIDTRLLEENQQHRYRFTLGHEGGHDIFHTGYLSYDPNQTCMFDMAMTPMIQCRMDAGCKKGDRKLWTDHDWMEWQANYFSSAILMPKCAVQLVANKYPRNSLMENLVNRARLVSDVSNTFDVSTEAAVIRLKDMGYIPSDDQTSYSAFTALMDFASIAI